MSTLSRKPRSKSSVYALGDPRTGEIRYIGIANDVYSRYAQHLNHPHLNKEKNTWMEDIKAAGIVPTLTISYHQSLDAWFICAGQPYQVKTAPQSVFERFVNASVPTAWGSEALGLYVALESTESDEAAAASTSVVCRCSGI